MNSPFLLIYISSVSLIFLFFVHLTAQIISELHHLQKVVDIEMIEFSYSAKEAWREMKSLQDRNLVRIRRDTSRVRDIRSHSFYLKDDEYSEKVNENNDKLENEENSKGRVRVSSGNDDDQSPVVNVDQLSVASKNGRKERKKIEGKRKMAKQQKKKVANEMCRKDCEVKQMTCPPGPPGPPGKKGRDGENGEAGANGVDGMTGLVVGVAGGCIKCPIGLPGPPGEPGPPGKKGKSGTNGISVKAVVGKPGPMGPPGNPGFPGFPGEEGPVGPPGKNSERPIGVKGPVGPPGPDGYQGAQGEAGHSYTTGRSGPPGVGGRNGRPGENGTPGKVGKMGNPGRDSHYCPCPKSASDRQSSSKFLLSTR